MWIWLRLWVELALLARSTQKPGLIPAVYVPLVQSGLGAHAGLWPQLVDPVRLLRSEGADYFCEKFNSLHPHLAQSFEAFHLRGAAMSAYVRQQRKAPAEAAQLDLLLPDQLFTTAEGEVMDRESKQKTIMVIRAVDNALGARDRPQHAFGQGLVHDAWAALQSMGDEQVDMVCRHIVRHRQHPLIRGATAERLMPQLKGLAMTLESDRG